LSSCSTVLTLDGIMKRDAKTYHAK